MITVPVPLPERRYQVHIGVIAPDAAAGHRWPRRWARPTGRGGAGRRAAGGAVAPGARRWWRRWRRACRACAQYALPAGESCKNLAAVERTCQWLAEQRLRSRGGRRGHRRRRGQRPRRLRRRRSTCAASSSRSCSTTLLGMVDASVGGKTGRGSAGGQEPGGRVSPAARGDRRPRLPGDAAPARDRRRHGRGGEGGADRRRRRCWRRSRPTSTPTGRSTLRGAGRGRWPRRCG